MSRAHTAGMLVVAILVATAGCSGEKKEESSPGGENVGGAASAGGMEGGVAVTVDSTEITEGQVGREQNRIIQEMTGRVNPQQISAMQNEIRQQAIDNLVNRALLEGVIAEHPVEISPEAVEERIGFIRSNFQSEQEFTDRLASTGVTEESLREEIRTGLQIEALIEELTKGVGNPTEEEIRAYYDGNQQQFRQPEQVRASHILIKLEGGAPENVREEKRLNIQNILSEVEAGGDFAELARQYSECPSSSRGGDLGFFGRGQMVKPFEEAAFSLRPGEVSDIVETRFGYHIIKLSERTEASTVSFEEARGDIEEYLHQVHRNEKINTYLEELRAAADIRYHAHEER